MEIEQVQ